MPNKCSGCRLPISNSNYMECSNSKCRNKYDLSCLNIKLDIYKGFTAEYKKQWTCPDCVSSKPKPKNTDDTPVRGSKTFTPCYVNTQRGNKVNFSPTITSDCGATTEHVDSQLLEELRELRSVMITRMDSQANAIKQLQNEFFQTKSDLSRLVTVISALEEKLEKRLSELTRQYQGTIDRPHESSSFSPNNIIKDNNKNINTDGTAKPSTASNIQQCVNNTPAFSPSPSLRSAPSNAPKTPVTQVPNSQSSINHSVKTNEDNWTKVQYKKPRAPVSLRCIAGPSVTSLKAAESRKHFHLWNMLSSVSDIKTYLNELCPQRAITVEQLKTANNYNSFKIGVPEDCFDKCFSVNVWPENARVKKWINYKKRVPSLSTQFRKSVGSQ